MLILVGSGSTGHVISALKGTEVLQQFFSQHLNLGTLGSPHHHAPFFERHFFLFRFHHQNSFQDHSLPPVPAAQLHPKSKRGYAPRFSCMAETKKKTAKRTLKCKSWKRAARREQSGRKEQENRSKIVLYVTANCM